MIIKSAVFVKSSPDISQCPEPRLPEYAFIGRSNVGKSSLINMLCGRKRLAMTSSSPGKTKLINHFMVNDSWYLVDLPGYGFARVSKKDKLAWERMIHNYIRKRSNLMCIFVLVDSRIPIQQLDTEMIDQLGKAQLPIAIVFTKCDKPKSHAFHQWTEGFRNDMLCRWEELPACFISSCRALSGRKEILAYIESCNHLFGK